MSYNEMELLNNNKVRKTGIAYWTGSPQYFTGSAIFYDQYFTI